MPVAAPGRWVKGEAKSLLGGTRPRTPAPGESARVAENAGTKDAEYRSTPPVVSRDGGCGAVLGDFGPGVFGDARGLAGRGGPRSGPAEEGFRFALDPSPGCGDRHGHGLARSCAPRVWEASEETSRVSSRLKPPNQKTAKRASHRICREFQGL